MADGPQARSQKSGRLVAGVAATLAVVAGFAAVYVTLGRSDNAGQRFTTTAAAETSTATETSTKPGASGPNSGKMAAFVFRKEPEPLPEIKFQDGDGKERTLAEWRGKVVLLNLWATWCLPCRKEMPALDRLQSTFASDKFQVVAISVDRTGIPGAKKFLEETNTRHLALYADPSAKLASSLRAIGLPATLLIDQEGREIGRLLGPAEWDGEDAKRLIGSAIK